MFARSLGPRARRRGVVLILILGMLGLVALIGVTFATFAGQSLKGSRDFMQGVARPSAEVLMDYALAQLINDTSNPLSAARGHSILRDMYGNDSLFRGVDPTVSAAAKIKGHLDKVYIGGTPQFLSLTAGGTVNGNTGTPFYNHIQYTTNIPTGGQYYGLNFTRWILSWPASGTLVGQTFEILEDDASGAQHIFTLSNNLGHPAGTSVPFNSADTATNIFNNPNIVQTASATRTQNFLRGAVTGYPISGFQLDCQYMRAFNGPGMTRPDYSSTAVYPSNFAAYGNFRLSGLDPDAVGMDEDYDACDLENWYLAIQSADGQVIIPSFHRPGILRYDTTSNPQVDDWTDTGMGAAKILRPRQGDHSPLFPADPRPNPSTGKITYDVDNDGDGTTDSVWLDLGYPVQRDPGGKLYKPLFAFMVLGLNGRLPLNTAGNLQARANGNGRYDPAAFTSTDRGTTAAEPPSPTGSQVAVPYPGAYTITGTPTNPYNINAAMSVPYPGAGAQNFVSQTWVDAPLWDHASHLGYSVNEINPKYALQNAPANAYASTGGMIAKTTFGLLPITGSVSYSQLDNAGMDVALTQLRNLLTGTVPTDLKNPVTVPFTADLNQDTNVVAVDGDAWVLPNNVLDPSDLSWGVGTMARTSRTVAGRWGEPEGVPTAFSFGADVYTAGASATPIAPFTNLVRAGRSVYVNGTNDVMDDDFDSNDPYFAPAINQSTDDYPAPINPPPNGNPVNLKAARGLPEEVDSFDGAGQRSVASERIRTFRTPIDPSASGRVVGYMHRPVDAHDFGFGYDRNGRVGFFRYFRPAGMPQRITYPYPSVAAPNYNIPLFSPATGANRSMNSLNGFQQAQLPGNYTTIDAESRNVAVMGAMPFDWKADPTAYPTPYTPTTPNGYDPQLSAPTINPTINTVLGTKINTDWGPNLYNPTTMTSVTPPYVALGPNFTANNTVQGVTNGYLGGSLNKDEADEMNLYTANLYDQPFGPSDLEWLYRKHDVDGASLTSRLSSLAPISFLNPADGLTRRRLFSTDSWDPISFVYAHDNPPGYAFEQVMYRGNLQPRFQFNSRFTPRASASFYGMNQVAALTNTSVNPAAPFPASTYLLNPNNFTHANPITTEFIPNPTLPMLPNPRNSDTASTSINNYIPNKGTTATLPYATDPAAASLFNNAANNAAPVQFSALSASAVPVQTPSLAHRDRRINLNYPLPTSNDPAEPVRQKWVRETYQLLKAILPPQSVDTPEELAALSQYAVNIIDFRDPDSTATRFVNTDLEVTPDLNDSTDISRIDQLTAGVRFARPADATPLTTDADPDFPYDPNLYIPNPDPADPLPARQKQTRFLVQHGMEYSPIAINEVLAYSHVYGNTLPGSINNRLYIELVNTLTDDKTADPTRPAANASSDIDLAGWDVVVTPDAYGWGRPDPITGEVTPVALPLVSKSAMPGANKPPQPNDPPAVTPPPAERIKYVNGGTGLPGFIFGRDVADSTLPNNNVASPLRVRAMKNDQPGNNARVYFVLANEAAGTGNVGTGEGRVPATPVAAEDTGNDINRVGTSGGSDGLTGSIDVDGLFPDYVLPFGPGVTKSGTPAGATLTYEAAPVVPKDVGRYFWVYLRRPANPFDVGKLTDEIPNREMVVVDSMRFRFVEGGGTPKLDPDEPVKGNNFISSTQRLQPYRGGHRVPVDTPIGLGGVPAGGTINPPSPRNAYGYSEQTYPTEEGNNNGRFNGKDLTQELHNTLGKANDADDTAWAHLPFHDRDFASVAELLLVPGCPPGLFTKQFVEEPYPGHTGGTGLDDSNLTGTITKPTGNNVGRKNFTSAAAADPPAILPVPSFPYLPDAFYYSAASVAPPDAPTGTMTRFPTEVGGWTGAGWYKMLEFFEVPSSANGATGLAANGVDFDWYRADVRPGLMNLNLVIDEEAFFGIIDDDRLNRTIAATNYLQPTDSDFNNHLPSIVTAVDANGYPTVLASNTSGVPTALARYPITDLTTVNTATSGRLGRGFVYRDPAQSTSLLHGMKSAFSDFLKLRHGGSGYLFGFGSGMPGSGGYVVQDPTTLAHPALVGVTKTPVASERPFRSLSFPDINYTVMRPASLPPSIYPANLPGVTNALPSWSFPQIPLDGALSSWTAVAIAANTGLAQVNGAGVVSRSLLNYSAAAADGSLPPGEPDPLVALTPGEAPSRFATPNQAYQYIFDPGLKNPFLPRQDRGAARLAPKQPDIPSVPPAPTRRLFQVPDNDGFAGGVFTPPSLSNASLHGAFRLDPTPSPHLDYRVNQPTTDFQLTTRDASALTVGGMPAPGVPPSLVLGQPVTGTPSVPTSTHAVLLPDNQTPDAPVTPRSLFLGGSANIGTGAEANTDNRQHPLYRTEWLQKVMNLTTVRTHQFAVWITVGFFEVVEQGTPELGKIDRLGAELNSAAGMKVRYRSFFVLDRTKATGFNPYYPGDFRDVVTYRRRIE